MRTLRQLLAQGRCLYGDPNEGKFWTVGSEEVYAQVQTRGLVSARLHRNPESVLRSNGCARGTRFVFQFYNLIPSLTVLENVALVNEIAEKPLDPREVLSLVGLEGRLDHFPSQLSGGEQQRVAVARAIVKSPDVLLCDEPTGALDYETGKVVLAAIVRANERLGTTTIIITHNAAIAGMADRVLRLGGGRIVGEERNARRLSPDEVQW